MEYTIASTSQMVDAKTGDWDWELIEKLGFPKKIFRSVDMPGTLAGHLRKEHPPGQRGPRRPERRHRGHRLRGL